jgi:hypothetical protein
VLGAVWYSARLPKMKAALQPTVDQEILQAV